ncbi:MAG: chromate efflux transporter [Candidatus Rokubacteria bacterium]|nr:chromate efflux transporter [Candidatus Rokubacteria bacterium]MBI3826862.1 chromate efflux transporter [Candidatus Rokubacteria bacterium]
MSERADAGRGGVWSEVVGSLLKLGATSYGGPAIMGVMQAELQEKRQWVSKPRFVEGLSVVNMLPGATATQLAIFLGYARGGWWGGFFGGLCFVLPAFVVMLALTLAYATLGVSPLVQGALYGLGPVVIAIFAVAVYRLGRAAASTWQEVVIGVLAAAVLLWSPLGVAVILVLAGGAGLLVFHSRTPGAVLAVLAVSGPAVSALWWPSALTMSGGMPRAASLVDLGAYFFKVGAFTIGGGLTMIAFIQQQVVDQFHWLTAREFIDGLALGQLTPGPVLMLAAYVGYKVAGIAGALVAATMAFLPSFVIMLVVLPVLDRVRKLAWVRAVMKGMGPAVIGVLAVSLVRLAPAALPDLFAVAILVATLLVLTLTRVGPFRLMIAASLLGVLRSRLSWWPGLKLAGRVMSAGG